MLTGMTGTVLNAIGILLGSLLGLMMSRQFSAPSQLAWRGVMGIVTVIIGLHLAWAGLTGGSTDFLRGLLVLILALITGSLAGRLLHIQKGLNRLGQYAGGRFAKVRRDDPNRFNEGFVVCAVLFCAGPLGIIGAVQDGLVGNWQPLAIKMVMDGLAAMGFVGVYGGGVALSAVPVFVYQGTLTLLVHRLEPFLQQHQLVDSINTVSGMLIFCVALVILELKKVELGNYLPCLAMAPLLTWLLKTSFR
jgi:uncharacterized membrane protein YqgA involved in biofilm formation